MTRPLHAIFLALIYVASAAAQNSESVAGLSQSKQTKDSVYAPLRKIPNKASARKNPLANDPEAVAAGEKLFARHCAECHGEMAQGGRRAPSLLAQPVQLATPGSLFFVLTNGVVRRGMPVWSKLPEAQRWQLVSYVRSLVADQNSSPNGK